MYSHKDQHFVVDVREGEGRMWWVGHRPEEEIDSKKKAIKQRERKGLTVITLVMNNFGSGKTKDFKLIYNSCEEP